MEGAMNRKKATCRRARLSPVASCAVATLLAASFVAHHATAYIWDGGGASNNWSDPLNWDPNIVPLGINDQSLTFAGVTRLDTSNDLPGTFILNALSFDANAGAFQIGGNRLEFRTSSFQTTPTIN